MEFKLNMSTADFEIWAGALFAKQKWTQEERDYYISYSANMTVRLEAEKTAEDARVYAMFGFKSCEAEAKMCFEWCGVQQAYNRPNCNGPVYSNVYYYPRITERQISSQWSWVKIYRNLGQEAKAVAQEWKVALLMNELGIYR